MGNLNIKFGTDCSNLFTVGNVTIDIHQLVTLCNFIEKGDKVSLDRYFTSDKTKPSNFLRRDSKVLTKDIKSTQIIEVKEGSVILTLAWLSLISSVIIPFVAILVEKDLQRRNRTITFNVYSDDRRLTEILDRYKRGEFGNGDDGRDNLFKELSRNNYNIDPIANDIYRIEQIVNHYVRRISLTLNMN